MIVSGEPAAFALIEAISCQHCGRPIQLRRVIGWIHVEGFYLCAIAQDAVKPFRAATPKP